VFAFDAGDTLTHGSDLMEHRVREGVSEGEAGPFCSVRCWELTFLVLDSGSEMLVMLILMLDVLWPLF
jgi:hypothetical protein